jgi:hypothetical protein
VGPVCHINCRGCGVGVIAGVEVEKGSPKKLGEPQRNRGSI